MIVRCVRYRTTVVQSPYGCRTVPRHPGHGKKRKSPPGQHKAAARPTYGDLAMLRTCSSLTVPLRRPHGLLAVASRNWSLESYDCQSVAVIFVANTCAAHKTLQILKLTFTNHWPQSRAATVRQQHDIWPRHSAELSYLRTSFLIGKRFGLTCQILLGYGKRLDTHEQIVNWNCLLRNYGAAASFCKWVHLLNCVCVCVGGGGGVIVQMS